MASQLESQAVMGIDPWVIIGGAVKIRRVLMQCSCLCAHHISLLTTVEPFNLPRFCSPLAVQPQR